MPAYAAKGLIGVLTPQANTTVEPEFAILAPPGVGLLTARLVSDKATMDDRLVDYLASLEGTLARFANAPLGAAAFACTGASYLIDPAEEAERLAALEEERGYPVITAADAIAKALRQLDADRVALLSPYGDALHGKALDYWRRRGLAPAQVERLSAAEGAFHPIYALGAEAADNRLRALPAEGLDAVVILGTGLPTLPTILQQGAQPLPILTSNLCLMWRACLALTGDPPTPASLRPWLSGEAWGGRLEARLVR